MCSPLGNKGSSKKCTAALFPPTTTSVLPELGQGELVRAAPEPERLSESRHCITRFSTASPAPVPGRLSLPDPALPVHVESQISVWGPLGPSSYFRPDNAQICESHHISYQLGLLLNTRSNWKIVGSMLAGCKSREPSKLPGRSLTLTRGRWMRCGRSQPGRGGGHCSRQGPHLHFRGMVSFSK